MSIVQNGLPKKNKNKIWWPGFLKVKNKNININILH